MLFVRKRNEHCVLVISSFLLCFCLNTNAQENSPPASKDNTESKEKILKLEDVIITGDKYSNDAFHVSDTPGSTATKSALPLLETPMTVNVVDEELIKLRGADSINKIVGYTAGITPETRGGNATRYDQLTMRGHDLKYTGYWNGMRLMYNGNFLALQIDPFLLQRVEILKGPASVLYGSNPPGGLINQVSHKPLAYDETKIALKTGTNALGIVSFDTNLVAWDEKDSGLSYRIMGKYFRRDGQAQTTQRERYALFPTVEWRINNNNRLILRALYQRDPAAGGYGMQPREGTLDRHPSGLQLEQDFYDGDSNFEKFDRVQYAFGFEFVHAFNKKWAFTQKFNSMKNSLKLENVGNNFSPLRKINPNDKYKKSLSRYILKSDANLDFITADSQLSGRVNTGAIEHNLLTGLDFQDSGAHRYTGIFTLPKKHDLNIFNPNNNQLTDRNGTLLKIKNILSVKNTTRQIGVYFQDQMKWEGLVLMYSGRYDMASSEQVIHRADADTLVSQKAAEDSVQTNRVGALYLFKEIGIAPFVSWSQSFEPAIGLSKSGAKFDPTLGEQIEYGLKYENLLGDIKATLSIFNLKQTDVIRPDTNEPQYSRQIEGLETEGFELEGEWRFNEKWQVRMAYSQIKMIQKDDKEPQLNGRTPVAVADRTFSNWWMYNPTSQWTLALGLRHVGESYGNAKNTFKVPSYNLIDSALSYEHRVSRLPVKWTLSASNITNKYYISSCYNSNVCWIGSERSIEAGVEVAFE